MPRLGQALGALKKKKGGPQAALLARTDEPRQAVTLSATSLKSAIWSKFMYL